MLSNRMSNRMSNRSPTGVQPESTDKNVKNAKNAKKPPASSGAAAADGISAKAKELLQRWNATPGIKPARSMGPSRVESLNARLAEDARWWDSVPVALKRVAQSSFCRGGGQRGWVATIKWFLQRETMNKILEGEYDDEKPAAAGEPPPKLSFRIKGEE